MKNRSREKGFALSFNWIFDRESNIPPRFRGLNKSLNRSLAGQSSTPIPKTAKTSGEIAVVSFKLIGFRFV